MYMSIDRAARKETLRRPGLPTCFLLLAFGAWAGGAAAAPSIEFTHVPAYGVTTDTALTGRVADVDPTLYHVAVYIFVGDNWWTKPSFAVPAADIAGDSTWAVDLLGANDPYATEIAAFLLPKAVAPPLADAAADLPAVPQAVAGIRIARGPTPRAVLFAGLPWAIKRRDFRAAPGPNYFSDLPEDIWGDADGLHLTVKQKGSLWYCTEAVLTRSFGYGTYIIQTHGRLDTLDPRIIAGMFTFDLTAHDLASREMDFEFAQWDSATDGTNAQYVMQPCSDPWMSPRATRYTINLSDAASSMTHFMIWSPGKVSFKSYYGDYLNDPNPPVEKLAANWMFADGSVPTPGREQFRINLWLMSGLEPRFGGGAQFTVTGFRYTSAVETTPAYLQFTNQPATVTTNMPDFPICCYFDAADSATVNGADVAPLLSNGGFRKNVSLHGGANAFRVVAYRAGQPVATYDKTVTYEPGLSTENRMLLYHAETSGTIVIDPNGGYVLGLMPGIIITAVSHDGRWLVDKNGRVYDASSHRDTGDPLDTDLMECRPVFSFDDQWCYYQNRKAAFSNRSAWTPFPANIDNRYALLVRPKYLTAAREIYFDTVDLSNDTIAGRFTAPTMTRPLWGDSAIDPSGRLALMSSFGYAAGALDIADVGTTAITRLDSLSDYMGEIAFTRDGRKALVGSYGNSYSGRGGVYVVDLETRRILTAYPQFGGASVVLDPNRVYVTSRFADHFGDGRVVWGMPSRRGVDVLQWTDGGTRLDLEKTFFLASTYPPYSTGGNLLLKRSYRNSVRRWSVYR
jgi:hypothetical protein